MRATSPHDRDVITALRVVAGALDTDCAYWHDGRFWFLVSPVWTLTVFPDSAGRFRIGACYGQTEVASLWVLPGDWDRLADMAQSLRRETKALTR